MIYLTDEERIAYEDLDEHVFFLQMRIFDEKRRGLLEQDEIEALDEEMRATKERRDALSKMQDDRETDAFAKYVDEQFGDELSQWFYIDMDDELTEITESPEYMDIQDHFRDADDRKEEYLQRKATEMFRKKYDLPVSDVQIPPIDPFTTYYMGIFVRGDSAFYCKMRGRTVFPLGD